MFKPEVILVMSYPYYIFVLPEMALVVDFSNLKISVRIWECALQVIVVRFIPVPVYTI